MEPGRFRCILSTRFTTSKEHRQVDDPRVARLFVRPKQDTFPAVSYCRRDFASGMATPLLTALVMSAPIRASAAPTPGASSRVSRAQGTSTGTLTVIRDSDTPDLDPQYAYDNGASMIFLATYEMLVQYNGDKTDEIAPMLATSWEESTDGTQVTFTIPEMLMFHESTLVM